jgi:hypothetical protein
MQFRYVILYYNKKTEVVMNGQSSSEDKVARFLLLSFFMFAVIVFAVNLIKIISGAAGVVAVLKFFGTVAAMLLSAIFFWGILLSDKN